jgi:hypothetical protein
MAADGKRPRAYQLMVVSDLTRAEWWDAVRGSAVAAVLLIVLISTGRTDLALPLTTWVSAPCARIRRPSCGTGCAWPC